MTSIFLCATCSIRAQSWLRTADSLYGAGAYEAAALAYERVLFLSPDSAGYAAAVLGKVECYKRQGDFTRAAAFIVRSLDTRVGDSLYYLLGYERALCLYLDNQFDAALAQAEQLQFRFPARTAPVPLRLISILSLNRLRRWKEARDLYHRLMDSVAGRSGYVDLYRHPPRLKKVTTAQWLSLATLGGGQFYAGRPVEGVVSILLQAGAVAYAVYCWEGEFYISAWLVGGGLAGAFHQGSERRAEYLVGEWNARAMEKFDRAVKSEVSAAMQKKAGNASAPPAM